jgi:hypothetical protein
MCVSVRVIFLSKKIPWALVNPLFGNTGTNNA